MLAGKIIFALTLLYGLWVFITIACLGLSHTREFKHYLRHRKDRAARMMNVPGLRRVRRLIVSPRRDSHFDDVA